jgi:hypothetical protein
MSTILLLGASSLVLGLVLVVVVQLWTVSEKVSGLTALEARLLVPP